MVEKLALIALAVLGTVLILQTAPTQAQSGVADLAVAPGPDGGLYVVRGNSVSYCYRFLPGTAAQTVRCY